jgi:CheW-like domain
MDEPGQRAGLRRLIAAWASDVQPGVPGDEEEPERLGLDGRLLRCQIGDGEFAFPLAAVTEVVPYAPARRLPGQPAGAGASPYVTALVEIGGELVAVLDPDRLCRG